MPICFDSATRTVVAEKYRLQLQGDFPFVKLSDPTGQTLADLFPFSAVHTSAGLDDSTTTSDWAVTCRSGEVLLEAKGQSSVWQTKQYWFRCLDEKLEYGIRVTGNGWITTIDYFGGYDSSSLRWGSGYYESGNHFIKGFNPEPNTREEIFFLADSSSQIDLTGVPIPGRDGWFFTPPPYCFSLETKSGWIGMGILAREGQNRYTDFRYQAGSGWFHLSLSYEGYTQVNGVYDLPCVTITFADDPYQAVQKQIDAWYASTPHAQLPPRAPADWWQRPIFCGWGAQCNLAEQEQGHSPDFATQANYVRFMKELGERHVQPGTIVIDDKWQTHYGDNAPDEEKWPDLPGFIQAQHQANRKVLLWLKFWDPDGLPVEECITNAAGKPVAADPTNPAYRRRFAASVEKMLARDQIDADGFKVDFSARIPSGPGMRTFGDLWGLELMRSMLELLYTTAKAIKPGALIITHTPHPYLSPYLDMIRLNDINKGKDLIPAMVHRQRIAQMACPDALIDTDNWPITNKADWLAYSEIQPELGVPALYYTTHIDATHEAIEEADYARLREIWATYLKRKGIH